MLGVFLFHLRNYHDADMWNRLGIGRVLAERGHFGVDVFFVLSGFLITGILLKSKEAENFFSVFYARRALRIWPVYYVAIAGIFLSGVVAGSVYPIRHQVWYWLNLSNWPSSYGDNPTILTHFWSLAVEEQFYFVWPLLVRLCSSRTLILISGLAVPLEFLLRLLPAAQRENQIYGEFINRSSYLHCDGLFLGAFIALLIWEGYISETSRGKLRVAIIGLFVALIPLMEAKAGSVAVLRSLQYTTWAALAAAVIALIAVNKDGTLSRALSVQPISLLGRVSYCFYVAQIPLLVWVHHFPRLMSSRNTTEFVMFPIFFFALVLAVSLLSWRLLEEPFLKLKRHFLYRKAY